jgi:hypothetical protein
MVQEDYQRFFAGIDNFTDWLFDLIYTILGSIVFIFFVFPLITLHMWLHRKEYQG